MITFLKRTGFVALFSCLTGCASTVDVFAGASADPEYSRVALVKLKEAIHEKPNAARFRVRWTQQRPGGTKIYPQLDYDKSTQTLTESVAGSKVTQQYAPVSESTLQVLVELGETPPAAIEHGATQQVHVDGQPYSPST